MTEQSACRCRAYRRPQRRRPGAGCCRRRWRCWRRQPTAAQPPRTTSWTWRSLQVECCRVCFTHACSHPCPDQVTACLCSYCAAVYLHLLADGTLFHLLSTRKTFHAAGYTNAYSRLVNAHKPERDPLPEVPNAANFLAQQLGKVCHGPPVNKIRCFRPGSVEHSGLVVLVHTLAHSNGTVGFHFTCRLQRHSQAPCPAG